MMQRPYLLFLGDVHDQLAAKTAHGIADWRPEWCVGQLRLAGCQASTSLPDVTVAEGAAKGDVLMKTGGGQGGQPRAEHGIRTPRAQAQQTLRGPSARRGRARAQRRPQRATLRVEHSHRAGW